MALSLLPSSQSCTYVEEWVYIMSRSPRALLNSGLFFFCVAVNLLVVFFGEHGNILCGS